MEFVELGPLEFDLFASSHEQGSFLQTKNLADMKRSSGISVYFLGVKKDDEIVAATLLEQHKVLLGRSSFYSPRGFLIDYGDCELLSFFTSNLKKFIKAKKGFRLMIDPNYVYRFRSSEGDIIASTPEGETAFSNLINLGYEHFGFNNYLEAMQVRWAYRLLLNEPYEVVKTRFSKSTRKNIESCYKKGLLVRKGTIGDLPVMEELFASTAQRKEFMFRDLNYYQKMYQYMGELMTIYIAYLDPKHYIAHSRTLLEEEKNHFKEILSKMNSSMVGAKLKTQEETSKKLIIKYEEELKKAEQFGIDFPEGREIGCLLSLKSGREYLTLTSGSLAEYHSFTPKYAMYDHHIMDAYKENFEACNFYGISGNFQKEGNPFYGVYEFKKGFSGNVVEYMGQFTLPVTKFNAFYNLLKRLRGK